MGIYDDVMRELMLALGAALFLASAMALIRRRADARRAAAGSAAPGRGRARSHGDDATDLPQAPLARTVTFMFIGLIVAVWAWASIATR